jgi:hypothetical protein
MELFEVVHANPDDASLLAWLVQATQDLVEAAAAMRALEVEWGFVAPPPPAAP